MSGDEATDRRMRRAARMAVNPALNDAARQRHQRELMGLRLSQSMWLRPMALDLDALPAEYDLSPPAGLAKLFFFLALFFLFMTGLPFLIMLGIPDTPWWVHPVLAVGPGLSLAALVVCWRLMRRRRRVRFEQDGVSVQQRGLPGEAAWREDYRRFRGVGLDAETVDTRYARKTFHIVRLVHGEPEKSLPLLITADDEPPVEMLERYARELNLRVLREAPS